MATRFLTLDGVRGVAALSIVFLHSPRYFTEFGWSGLAMAVDLFFVLSGFVMSSAYDSRFAAGLGWWEFAKRRFIRFYPLYLLGTLLGIVEAIATIYHPYGPIAWTWTKFWGALPFAVVMVPAVGQSQLYPFNGVMWTIFFEFVVNLVWAAFWRPLQSTRLLLWVIILSGVGLALSVWWWQTMWLGGSWNNMAGGIFRVSYSFFLGVLLYRLRASRGLPKLPPLLFLAAVPALLFLPMSLPIKLAVVLFVLPWLVLLGAQVQPTGALTYVCDKLGAGSYAMYCVHRRLYMLSYGAGLQVLNIDLQLFAPWVGFAFMAGLVVLCWLLETRFHAWAKGRMESIMLRRPSPPEPAMSAP